MQRDFVNVRICTAFWCIHHCPFLHTCGIYPHDHQNTWLVTTPNNELGQEEDNTAPPFVEEVYQAVRVHFCHVQEGVPHLICHPGQVQDTAQVWWQALAEMGLSGIRKLVNPLTCQEAVHCTIVKKCRCDPQCFPALTRISQAAIYEPFVPLKHPPKCISPQESSVLLARLLFTQYKWVVHYPSLSEWVVFNWLLLISTTSLLSKALQSVSCSALYLVELPNYQSGSHTLYSLLRNIMP